MLISSFLAAVMAFQLVSCDEDESSMVRNDTDSSSQVTESVQNKETDDKTETQKAVTDKTDDTVKTETVIADAGFEVQYSEKDLDGTWSENECTLITASDSGFDIKGNGADSSKTTLEITSSGTYLLRGSISDGNIVINSPDTKAVRLIFDGFSISCSYDAPINVPLADKVIITLADNTKNSISDTARQATGAEDEATGAVFCRSNLTFNGNGNLKVNAEFADGIVSKDKLRIVSGNIDVTSADDGFTGRDLFAMKDGNIKVTSSGDGIKSTYDTDNQKGQIVTEGGTIDITTQKDGIQSANILMINGGEIKITAGGGSENGEVHRDDMTGGRFHQEQNTQEDTTATESKKGLKSPYLVLINGGTVDINSADDAVHSDNNIIINNGTIKLASGDDGLHAETTIDINGGNLDVSESYEGVEAQYIYVNGGVNNIVSSDDGFNASASDYSSETVLTFNGGDTVVDASGDGLDSNGNVYIKDGKIIVNGPVNNGNGALDCGDRNNEVLISGGTLVVAGSSGMFELPSENSTQNIVAASSLSLTPGMVCTLVDENDNELISFDVIKNSQAIAISSPDILSGKKYKLLVDDASQKTEVATFETNSVLTVFGTFMGGGFGGGRPGGGMKFEGEMPFPDGEMPEKPFFEGEMPFPDGEMPEKPFFEGEMPFPDGEMRPEHNGRGDIKQMPRTTDVFMS